MLAPTISHRIFRAVLIILATLALTMPVIFTLHEDIDASNWKDLLLHPAEIMAILFFWLFILSNANWE